MISVRLFAAASEAAGTDATRIALGAGQSTVGTCRDALAARFGGELTRVLERCSFLVNGERAEASHEVVDGDQLDVLPPFAGG